MIINNTYKFIFVHVPKSAGTTVTKLLSGYSAYCDIEVGGTAMGEAVQPFFRNRYGLSKHSTATEIRTVVGEAIWKRYFTFALVRNPYARAHSSYRFLRRMRKETGLDVLAPLDGLATFQDFVKSTYFQTEGMDRILMPQSFWLRSAMRMPAISLDYVGRVEAIEDSLRHIADQVPGLFKGGGEIEVPVLNSSDDPNGEGWQTLISERGIERLVFEKYRLDFEAFGYARMEPSGRP
jgi:hypothetical protein